MDLILSLAQVASIPWPDGKRHTSAWHYFNHLLINPTGNRFVFLHRYRPVFHPHTLRFEGGFVTRMLSANVDGSDLFVLDPSGHTSHFIWDDATHVTMWTKPTDNPAGFYQMTDRTDQVVPVGSGVMTAPPRRAHGQQRSERPQPMSHGSVLQRHPVQRTP